MPATIPTTITVIPLDDPVVERHGYGPNSRYVEAVMLPTLGPTSLWLYRRVGAMVLTADHTEVDLAELGRELGVGARVARNSPVVKALRRLEMFGVASWNGQNYAVRRALAPVSERRLDHLPEFARAFHRQAQRLDGRLSTTA